MNLAREKKMRQHSFEVLKNAVLAGGFSAVISYLLNYFVLPFPVNRLDNAIGHGIGGGISGFISVCMAMAFFIIHNRSVLSASRKASLNIRAREE
jgi:hypothetical protein